MIGRKRRIVLGKHSGSASVEAALQEMNYQADENQVKEIVKRIKQLGDEGKRVTDADLMAIADAVPRHRSANRSSRCASSPCLGQPHDPDRIRDACRERGGDDRCIDRGRSGGCGNGSRSASAWPMWRISGSKSTTWMRSAAGTDALVDVTVRLSKDGKIITSRGARTDIIMASVEAMIAGMNRLLREET